MKLPQHAQLMENYNSPPVYEIHSGTIQIFPFTIPDTGLEIYTEHTAHHRPDFSLRCWVSEIPLEKEVKPITFFREMFAMPKRQVRLFVGNTTQAIPEWAEPYYQVFRVDTSKTYYFNVHNLINSPNTYELAFIPYGE